MALQPKEMDRLTSLLGEARSGDLSRVHERELRFLLSARNPRVALLPLGEVVRIGFVVVGLHALMEMVGQPDAVTA